MFSLRPALIGLIAAEGLGIEKWRVKKGSSFRRCVCTAVGEGGKSQAGRTNRHIKAHWVWRRMDR